MMHILSASLVLLGEINAFKPANPCNTSLGFLITLAQKSADNQIWLANEFKQIFLKK